MSNLITLYDLPGNAAKDIAWSSNTWKVRFALNIKGLPYKTSWVEYPDIETVAKQIGAEPTAMLPSGPFYTVPIIHDPSTNSVIADSFKIIQYLDKTYPDTPTLIPKGTAALQSAFMKASSEKIGLSLSPFITLPAVKQLPPRSQAFLRKKREAKFGMPIEEVAPEGSEKRANLWKETLSKFAVIGSWLSVEDGAGPFIMGDQPSFVDVALASSFTWLKRLLGEDSEEWKEFLEADGGRWKRMVVAFAKWETVDEEGLKYQIPT